MAFSELWALEMLLAAFAGGAFGAALGALPAFAFTGVMVIAGEVIALAGRLISGVTDAGGGVVSDAGTITGLVAFGPVFGPHISFAGGAAAAAYAAKKGYMDTGFDYHEAKNILFAQGTKPDVLAVGGLFGIVGYWLTTISATLSLPWDPIAMGVVLSAVVHRLAFGYDLIGDAKNGLFNMRPFKKGNRRIIGEDVTGQGSESGSEAREDSAKPDGGSEDRDEGRFVVEPWLPHQYKWPGVTMIGFIAGVLGAFIAYYTGSPFLAFGISAASLLFLACGTEQIPVTHHMTLPASTAALALAPASLSLGEMTPAAVQSSVSLTMALLVGGLFGIIGALAGEVIQRIFYAHADTHLDPPAAGIVIATFVIAVCAMIGLFPQSVWVPLP